VLPARTPTPGTHVAAVKPQRNMTLTTDMWAIDSSFFTSEQSGLGGG